MQQTRLDCAAKQKKKKLQLENSSMTGFALTRRPEQMLNANLARLERPGKVTRLKPRRCAPWRRTTRTGPVKTRRRIRLKPRARQSGAKGKAVAIRRRARSQHRR